MKDDMLDIPDFLKRKRGEVLTSSIVFSANTSTSTSTSTVANNSTVETTVDVPGEDEEYIEPEQKLKMGGFVPNVQYFTREKASNVVAEIEGLIDDGIIDSEWSMYDYLKKCNYGRPIVQYVQDHFYRITEELAEVITNKEDEDLQYAYRSYSPEAIQYMAEIFLKFYEDCNTFIKNEKATRTHNKKPKKYSVAKVIKGVQYAIKYDKYRLVSVDPSKVVGAQELWTFNTKNSVITVYRALDRGGLTFKGSKVMNWDENTSLGKRVGRKLEERIKEILEGGKVVLRKFMDDINTDKLEPTRITKNTILLRVI